MYVQVVSKRGDLETERKRAELQEEAVRGKEPLFDRELCGI